MKTINALKTLTLAGGCAVLALVSAPAAKAAQGTPGVAPPHSRPYGLTYGQWSAVWWQWAYSAPTTANPLFLDGIVDLSLHQPDGPVWFLGGVIGFAPGPGGVYSADRTGTVPVGKALFVPILNYEFDNPTTPIGWPNNYGNPPVYPGNYTEAQLFTFAKAGMDTSTSTECDIDGKTVTNLSDPLTTPYRAVSPVFDYWLPPTDNVQQFWGFTDLSGRVRGAVSDGVYLMLEPLPVGEHTIHFTGSIPSANFTLDITYHITVVPHHGDRDGDRDRD